MRKFLLISLLLNALLGAVLLWQRNQRVAVPLAPTVYQQKTNRITVVRSILTRPADVRGANHQFHWSLLESEQFPIFIANLRAVGCPERIIQHIVLAELDEIYRKRRAALEHSGLEFSTIAQYQLDLLNRKAQIVALHREELDMARALLNQSISWKGFRTYLEQPELDLVVGYLPLDAALSTVAELEATQLPEFTDLDAAFPFIRAEEENLWAEIGSVAHQRLSQLLTPNALQELQARLTLLHHSDILPGRTDGFQVSAEEYRAFFSSRSQQSNVFQFVAAGEKSPFLHLRLLDETPSPFEQFFGEERADEIARVQEPEFQTLWEIVQRHGGEAEQAHLAFGLHQVAMEEFEGETAAPEVIQQVLAAVTDVLGVPAAQEYFTGLGGAFASIQEPPVPQELFEAPPVPETLPEVEQ
jgi:hypothetical protein